MLRICEAAAVVVALTVLLFFEGLHAYPGNSDRATIVLQGQAMADGHVLLHGWRLAQDSFWLSDALLYALLAPLSSLAGDLMPVEPSVFMALLVLVGVLTVSECRGRRLDAATTAGGGVIVALLVFPVHFLAYFVYGQGFHIATVVFAYLAFVCLSDASSHLRWATAVILLAAGFVGDPLMVGYGIVPVLLAGIVAMARTREWRRGVHLVAAASAGIVVGEGIRIFAGAAGGFSYGGAAHQVANLHQIAANIGNVFVYGADLTGVTTHPLGTGDVPAPLHDLHIAGAGLIAVCLLAALANILGRAIRGADRVDLSSVDNQPVASWWRLDDMLLIATVGSAATYSLLAGSSEVQPVRYLVPALIYASLLSGRFVARTWPKVRRAARRPTALVATAIGLGFCAGVGMMIAAPQPARSDRVLAAWLESHHLHNGLGDYWAASITTLDSRGAVSVRPVMFDARDDQMRPYGVNIDMSWYTGQRFNFVVYDLTHAGGVDFASATDAFGQPQHRYVVDGYVVLVWARSFAIPAQASAREEDVPHRVAALRLTVDGERRPPCGCRSPGGLPRRL